MLRILQHLTGSNSAHPSLAGLRDLLHHAGRQLHLCLRYLALRNGLAAWQSEQIQEAKRQHPAQFKFVFKCHAFKREHGVGNTRCLIDR